MKKRIFIITLLLFSILFLCVNSASAQLSYLYPRIEEADGDPSGIMVKIIFPNGSLTQSGFNWTTSFSTAGGWTYDPNSLTLAPTDPNVGIYLTLDSLTASRLLALDPNKMITSTDVASWIAGTTDQVNVTDDGDGTITLSLPQDIDPNSTPTFDGINIYIPSASATGIMVKGADNYTGDFLQAKDPNDVEKFVVEADGDLQIWDTSGIWFTASGTTNSIDTIIGSSTDYGYAGTSSNHDFYLGAGNNSWQKIETDNGYVGFGAGVTPDNRVDIQDPNGAQLRLTHTNSTDYAQFQVDANGDLAITPTGGDVSFAGNFTASGNVAGATYGDDASVSNAELKTLDDGATTEILVGGGAGSAPVWTTATGTEEPARANSPTFKTQITTPIITNTTDVAINTGNGTGDALIVNTDRLYVDGNTGNVGIGTTSPDKLLHVEKAGTVKTNNELLKLTNTGNAANMSDTLTGILFEQSVYDPNLAGSFNTARIQAYADTNCTNTASTQDGGLKFETALNGTLTNAMVIDSSGNVGIGTTSPNAKLEISSTSPGLSISNTTETDNGTRAVSIKSFHEMADTTKFHGGEITFYHDSNDSDKDTAMKISLNDGADADGALTERMVIDSTGNVGIGTTAPENKLHLEATASGSAQGLRLEAHAVSATDYVPIRWANGSNSFSGMIYGNSSNNSLNLHSGNHASGDINFYTGTTALDGTGASQKMVISNTGNVGIGTTTPAVKLDVLGSVYVNDPGDLIDADFSDPNTWSDGWNISAVSGSTITYDSGTVKFTRTESGTDTGNLRKTITVETGKYYKFQYTVTAITSGYYYVAVGSSSDGQQYVSIGNYSNATTRTAYFTTTGTTVYIRFYGYQSNGNSYNIDNISLKTFSSLNVGNNNFTMIAQTSTQRVGIGTKSPASILEVSKVGTAKAVTTLLELTNRGNAADMDATEGQILGNGYYYDAVTPAKVDLGAIRFGCEQDMTSTASTQDGYIQFRTSLDGAMTDAVRIDSSGNVGIGTTSPGARLEIDSDPNSGHLLELDQDDSSDAFVKFDGTSAADQTKNISTVTDPNSWIIQGYVKIDVNGDPNCWIQYYHRN